MAKEKRLIDANALKRKFDEKEADDVELYGCVIVECFPADDAKEIVDKMPTVDAVEVIHGRWLKLSPWNNHTQSCLCLNCDSISYQKKSGVYIGKIPNYCHNCGAKMDGDGNGSAQV